MEAMNVEGDRRELSHDRDGETAGSIPLPMPETEAMMTLGVELNGTLVEGMTWQEPLTDWQELDVLEWARNKWGPTVTLRSLTPDEVASLEALGRFFAGWPHD